MFNRFLSLTILSFALLVSCNKQNAEKPKEEAKETKKEEKIELIKLSKEAVNDIKLELAEVKEGELTGEIFAPAKLTPNQDLEALVGSLVQGRVSKVFANLGDYVKKGQNLMAIEGLEIGEIKAQFLKAKANYSYAEANYNRLKTLIDQNVGSQKSFLEAKSEYEKAKAEFNAEDKKIHSIGLSDKELESDNDKQDHVGGILYVKSPIDGVVVDRSVVIGQLIEPSSNSFRIMNTSSLFVDGQLYESDLNRISGKPTITFKTSAFPDKVFKGSVTYISDVIDKETKTIKIRATISNSDRKLKPEMFGEMYIPSGKSAKGLIVPAESVIREGNENYLFIAVNDTTFMKKDIVIGSTQGEFIEVKAGIKKGDRIVAKGTFMIKSEMKKSTLEAGE